MTQESRNTNAAATGKGSTTQHQDQSVAPTGNESSKQSNGKDDGEDPNDAHAAGIKLGHYVFGKWNF